MPNYILKYEHPNKPTLPLTPLPELAEIRIGDYLVYDKSYSYYNELHFLEVTRLTDKYVGFRKRNGLNRHLFPSKIPGGYIVTNNSLHMTARELLRREHYVALLKAGAEEGDGRVDNTK